MNTYRIGFVLEQALGHVTHTRNLQANVPKDPAIQPAWALIPWETSGLAARTPIYKSNWTVRAGLRARRAVGHMARQHPLDGLFFHTQVPAVLAANWLRRLPSVVSLDATPIQYDELGQFYGHDSGPAWLEAAKWRLNRDCFRAARKLVAWTEWTRAGLLKDYEVLTDKVAVIPPGVNARDWHAPAPRSPGAAVKILFVGGNLERKGGLVLLEAFRVLRALGAELHLATRDAVPDQPGVRVYRDMQPNSDALKQLYWACDIFCLPTYGDCLPMVLSEAGAAGLPLVSTRVAAIPEIARDGETGLLVPPGDAAALGAALRRLIEDADLRRRLGARAIEVVDREYDAEKNTLRLLDLIKGVVDASRAAAR